MSLPHVAQVVPVIDLSRGQVVRGVRGQRAAYRPIVSSLVAGSEPLAVAQAMLAHAPPPAGCAPLLYVADIDALQGLPAQREALARLLAGLLVGRPDLSLWLDAGFRDVADAVALRRALGAACRGLRPVYGSETLASPAALAELGGDDAAILSLDCRSARLPDRSDSWRSPTLWPRTVIVMTLDRVGADAGPDLETLARLRSSAPGRTWIGAGGVRDRDDLRAAAAAGASAWLVASAMHDGALRPD
jgi:phosphoribosylformimino-5-aminoimidazole carboxamide ribotide isomerase